MEYVTLGDTGTVVSTLCFGTWRFGADTDRETAHDLLDACEAHGVNFLDTANVYGDGESERWIGEWLADRDREDYVLASKVYGAVESRFNRNSSRKNVRAEIEGTLERLGTDYLDLYYVHRWDDDTPILETLRALDDLVREGRVHTLGASNAAAWKLTKALWTSDAADLERFAVLQPQFSATHRDPVAAHRALAADQDLAVCPYSPLAGGFLTGKYDREGDAPADARYDGDDDFSEADWAVLDAVQTVADEVDATPAQVSLRWLMDREAFTCVPIFGATTRDQFAENVGAVDVDLSEAQVARIDDAA
jgi:aryl-alcohol dehydrogenase-like predicted oxidoreductase